MNRKGEVATTLLVVVFVLGVLGLSQVKNNEKVDERLDKIEQLQSEIRE